jgi:hypothetical protein
MFGCGKNSYDNVLWWMWTTDAIEGVRRGKYPRYVQGPGNSRVPIVVFAVKYSRHALAAALIEHDYRNLSFQPSWWVRMFHSVPHPSILYYCCDVDMIRVLSRWKHLIDAKATTEKGVTAVMHYMTNLHPPAGISTMLREFPDMPIPSQGTWYNGRFIWSIHFRMAMVCVLSTDMVRHFM